jgi:hypothetical protein
VTPDEFTGVPEADPSKGVTPATTLSPLLKDAPVSVLAVWPTITAPLLNQRYVYWAASPSASLQPLAEAVSGLVL